MPALDRFLDIGLPGLVFLGLCAWLIRKAMKAARTERDLEEERLGGAFREGLARRGGAGARSGASASGRGNGAGAGTTAPRPAGRSRGRRAPHRGAVGALQRQ